MVIYVLSDQHYDAVGPATKLPVTHDRKARSNLDWSVLLVCAGWLFEIMP